jgi:hypothetical protein
VVLTVMEENGGTRKLEAKSQSQSGSGRKGRKGRKVKRGSDGIGIKLYRGVLGLLPWRDCPLLSPYDVALGYASWQVCIIMLYLTLTC